MLDYQNVYNVQPGDSLYLISKKLGVTTADLKRANQLSSNVIYVGQQLGIPESREQSFYTVQQGDSLYLIANRFNISVNQLKRLNNLENNIIYVGQLLKVTDMDWRQKEYSVKRGDSLYSIAKKFNTIPESIMELNDLESTELSVGQKLIIPAYTEAIVNVNVANIRSEPSKDASVVVKMVRGAKLPVVDVRGNWYRIELYNGKYAWVSKNVVQLEAYDESRTIVDILGYYTLAEGPQLPSSYESFVNNTRQISQLGLFMFRIDKNNPTAIEKFGDFTDEEVRTLVNIGHRNNVKMLAVVHNLLYEEGVGLAKEVIEELVSSPANIRAFALNLVELIEKYNLDGVDIDIEDVFEKDKEGLVNLYEEIGRVLNARGYYFSTAVPSKTGPKDPSVFAKPFNYNELAKPADQFVIMLYNEHGWPGSGPGPVVSIGRMETVLKYAMTQMPKEEIMAAVSVFGFDFNLTTERNQYVTYTRAMELADKYNKEVIFDEETQTPMFAYTDEEGNKHEVWFENAASIRAKARLADQLGIKGLALWRLGMEDPAMWEMLEDEVVVSR